MMTPVDLFYDTDEDQIVVRIPAAEGEGDVELVRMDLRQLPDDAKRRLRHVRDQERPQPEPGDQAVTRR